ncbi:hypothetical protein GOBAR_AA14951 [Gossypium barbadense]|uniref:Uncharacterized protein n=1 Tax=Gossypium barbadense TaxID=3634 RepID=A0A2P5XQR8_GOSBA|nr:hypothetical protein GOBAR_AA14951 [Gossypium barbadense]
MAKVGKASSWAFKRGNNVLDRKNHSVVVIDDTFHVQKAVRILGTKGSMGEQLLMNGASTSIPLDLEAMRMGIHDKDMILVQEVVNAMVFSIDIAIDDHDNEENIEILDESEDADYM